KARRGREAGRMSVANGGERAAGPRGGPTPGPPERPIASVFRRKGFWLVAGVAVLVRLGAWAATGHPAGVFYLPDSAEYDRLAWNLVTHGDYSLAESEPRAPDLTRTPVYPVFVALCYLFGGHSPGWAVAAQLALSVGTCLLTRALGERFLGAGAG